MLQISKILPAGKGLASVLLRRAATVSLDWDIRQKSRFPTTDTQGRKLAVFLPRGTVLRGGDVLVAEDGSLIRVEAAPQNVLRITACTEQGSSFDLTRAAYHLGNRHVPIELKPDHLKIEPDHVLADMLRAMHMTVVLVSEPFEPESGAYGDHGGSSHHHGHSHDHGHDQPGHEHTALGEPHMHGPDCKHEHAAPAASPMAGKRIAIPIRSAGADHVHSPGGNHDH
ncbi:urease accessory protein UreE [Limnohabitans sp. T6-5]|uniref:urease accessory protein UreE n=1 Tax=Limnohabitans sp. T6-5 TaxID=1100724 RepID=UPI000D39593B|nr:urease accessory protein UreE [Limnohabitans sp. T6-5]PUE11392.1 urease accessory protein UreE [Limnohabitans sp. T6-5]